ncbi:hypothetical protein [Methylobacterium longum]|uniref:Uncharacterized protein n=1 Tax=Methylobacterium longum TaxID=767694 RepID=A0ABT8APN0_9HYPH|nr:hypothetical protein [Methylobacterium longum]MDN3571788.1 hypothetical protein [Methylobacterium longum]GJE13990.1 hypothetical protein FOHLNKBM_5059 [Methylobacterium longum]
MTIILILSVAAPLVTGVTSLLWAGFVARGMSEVVEIQSTLDLRTW